MRHSSSTRPLALLCVGLLPLGLLFSCTLPPLIPPARGGAETDWAQEQIIYRQELLQQKHEVNRHGKAPRIEELGKNGSMVIWRWSLDGGPGWEYIKMRFTYRNTTDRTFDYVRVWLEVRDADGKLVDAHEKMLSHPLGISFTPGNTYTDTFRVLLRGAHRKSDSWSWKVGAELFDVRVVGVGG
ncbi:MAG: hypothetical protein ACYST0_07395 [Planctomycetota bacterium]